MRAFVSAGRELSSRVKHVGAGLLGSPHRLAS